MVNANWSIDNAVKIYQANIDRLISQFGKTVKLYFKTVNTDVTNINFDQIHGQGRKPSYKGDGPTETTTTDTMIALVQFNPKDYQQYNINVQQGKTVVRLKSHILDVPNLQRAEYIVPDVTTAGVIGARFKLAGTPIPKGLKTSRYAVSFWVEI